MLLEDLKAVSIAVPMYEDRDELLKEVLSLINSGEPVCNKAETDAEKIAYGFLSSCSRALATMDGIEVDVPTWPSKWSIEETSSYPLRSINSSRFLWLSCHEGTDLDAVDTCELIAVLQKHNIVPQTRVIFAIVDLYAEPHPFFGVKAELCCVEGGKFYTVDEGSLLETNIAF